MQCPVATLAGSIRSSRYLDEAVVEGEIVSERVLPLLLILAVIGELFHYELVDVAQREHFLFGGLNGHRRQSYV